MDGLAMIPAQTSSISLENGGLVDGISIVMPITAKIRLLLSSKVQREVLRSIFIWII